ncbi:MAG: aminoglycoside phosphotransferase family protein [Clostridia bacterium]|nr:aminoglycoside phosphotransferase family protein [Clostridia bacterium]
MNYDFCKIISNFKLKGELVSCVRYGEGHINETYLAVVSDNGAETKYILQKINKNLFQNVDKLMNNIRLVTEHTRKKVAERGGNPDRESLSIVYAIDGKPYYRSPEYDEYFRVYIFITDAVAHQREERPGQFYQSAVAFGEFANMLADFNASELYEVLPDFHNTEKRFNDFKVSLAADKLGRAAGVQAEINFVLEREKYCKSLVNLIKTGQIPLKVTHNDTKLNNVMLDEKTDKPVAVIDLDTVMPGTICYDFGDSIRFGCNTAAEDEKDLSKVNFDIDLFEEYTKGYLSALGKSITPAEKNNLAFGAILMTYECGMRFLSDYLNGDTYFRIRREGHNLDRARTQFKLVSDMEKRFDEMKKIVAAY